MDAFTKSPIVSLRDGDVQGIQREHDALFYGVPYAGPLVEETRFAAPQPVKPWSGVLKCTSPAATCQRFHVAPNPAIPEPIIDGPNQLHLTIYAPNKGLAGDGADGSGEKLPVFVWFHGGGFTAGSNAIDWWDGQHFTAQDVVVVVANYRLGAEGWMPLLHTESYNNRGLFDQVAALEWVQKNISAFGGDANRVTIGGQSAGATSVLTLMSAPAADGLFQKAFAASPAFIRLPQNDKGKKMIRRGKMIFPRRDFVEEDMRTWSMEDMRKLEKGVSRLHPFGMPYYPTIDAETHPEPLQIACRKAPFRKRPLLIGATSEEFSNISYSGPKVLISRLAAEVALRAAGINKKQRHSAIAAHANDLKRGRVGALMTDIMIRSTVIYAAEGREAGQDPDTPSTTWVYDFRWPGRRGAEHCSDLPLWWGNLQAEGADVFVGPSTDGELDDSNGQVLSDMMNRALIRFIKDGDPGWPAYTDRTRVCMAWDERPEVETDSFGPERTTWLVDPKN